MRRRQRMLRHVTGRGLEVGPGHVPLAVLTNDLQVRYVDRWEPSENQALFPELEGAEFPQPHLVSDLNKEGLAAVDSQSEDFVVASHVLEHMANPLRLLTDFYRVLRPGGVLLILLPDRRMTFDKTRSATTLSHLIQDYEDDVEDVDDDHLLEFLTHVHADQIPLTAGPERESILAYHRKRSIHVHCWTFDEFVEVVEYSIEHLGAAWEFVDALTSDEGDPPSEEFGLVLRRSAGELEAGFLVKLFRESLSGWMAGSGWRDEIGALEGNIETLEGELSSTRSQLRDLEQSLAKRTDELTALGAQLAATQSQLSDTMQSLDLRTAHLDALLRTRTFRYTRFPRAAYGRLRRFVE